MLISFSADDNEEWESAGGELCESLIDVKNENSICSQVGLEEAHKARQNGTRIMQSTNYKHFETRKLL